MTAPRAEHSVPESAEDRGQRLKAEQRAEDRRRAFHRLSGNPSSCLIYKLLRGHVCPCQEDK
jgi:hypothetical protein